MIAAESYSGVFISQELTPTLWRLTHNGFYFSDYYQPEWGGSTTTGEMAYLCGLAPQWGDESMTNTTHNNMYFTMGNQLQRLGYSSIAFHSGYYKYYKRHTTHENLGYNQFLGVGNGIEDIISYEYAPDSDLFENTIPLYIDHEPFSVYYMTLSGHAPYVSDSPLVEKYYDQVDAAFGDEYAKKTKYYICYQMELEAAMSLLVQRSGSASQNSRGGFRTKCFPGRRTKSPSALPVRPLMWSSPYNNVF
jgi:lipoteichoic acid synthase